MKWTRITKSYGRVEYHAEGHWGHWVIAKGESSNRPSYRISCKGNGRHHLQSGIRREGVERTLAAAKALAERRNVPLEKMPANNMPRPRAVPYTLAQMCPQCANGQEA